MTLNQGKDTHKRLLLMCQENNRGVTVEAKSPSEFSKKKLN